jgi:hypothetical protein
LSCARESNRLAGVASRLGIPGLASKRGFYLGLGTAAGLAGVVGGLLLVRRAGVTPQTMAQAVQRLSWRWRGGKMTVGDPGYASSKVVNALAQGLGDERYSADVRARAAEALGWVGQAYPKKAAPALAEALGNTERPVRERAAEALVELGQTHRQAVEAALNSALDDANEHTWQGAAEVMRRLRATD